VLRPAKAQRYLVARVSLRVCCSLFLLQPLGNKTAFFISHLEKQVGDCLSVLLKNGSLGTAPMKPIIPDGSSSFQFLLVCMAHCGTIPPEGGQGLRHLNTKELSAAKCVSSLCLHSTTSLIPAYVLSTTPLSMMRTRVASIFRSAIRMTPIMSLPKAPACNTRSDKSRPKLLPHVLKSSALMFPFALYVPVCAC
jgi:hypothetical protein